MQNEISSDSTLKNVTVIDHTEGASQAYQRLKSDYDTYAKTHTSKETTEYWDVVNNGLVASKTIGDLSIGWASENSSNYGESDGSFNKGDLRAVNQALAPSATSLDVSMATALLDKEMYGKLVSLSYDVDGDKSITQADVQVYLSKNAQAVQQNKALNLMAPLMAGQPPLFRLLDRVGSQDADNKITRQDLQKFLNDYDDSITKAGRAPESDGQKYSLKNHDYVKKLFDGWDSSEVKSLRGNWPMDGEINLTSLGNAAKMRDVNGEDFSAFSSRFTALYDGLKNDNAVPIVTANSDAPPVTPNGGEHPPVLTTGISGDTESGAIGPAEFGLNYNLSAPAVVTDMTSKF